VKVNLEVSSQLEFSLKINCGLTLLKNEFFSHLEVQNVLKIHAKSCPLIFFKNIFSHLPFGMALSVATEFIGEVEIDGRLKIKGEEKVFSNHTHVALSSLTIFILFFSFASSGLVYLILS